jgi:hypothetical protein
MNSFVLLNLFIIQFVFTNTNNINLSDDDINLLEKSKDIIIDEIFSFDTKLIEKKNRILEKFNFTKNEEVNKKDKRKEFDNKLINILQDELAKYIKLFHLENKDNIKIDINKNEIKNDINDIDNKLNKRKNIPNILEKNNFQNSIIKNKVQLILKENQDNFNSKKQQEIINELSQRIFKRLINENKKRLILDLLNNKIKEHKIEVNPMKKNMDLTKLEKLIDIVFNNNSTLSKNEKNKIKKEIRNLISKSKKPENVYDFANNNDNELNRIINETLFCQNYCSNNGYCFNGKCYCKPGYQGKDCSSIINKKSCINDCNGDNGKCDEKGVCLCSNGFSGVDCSIKSKLIIH